MATHRSQPDNNTAYFVTFTCFRWLPLIEKANVYQSFSKWFSYLNAQHTKILSYVIMPNHFHGLFFLSDRCEKSINQLVANGKRFLAYEIIQALKDTGDFQTLLLLSGGVSENELKKGKRHQVFRLSFDAKECKNRAMVEQKFDYIHRNPVSGKWRLASEWTQYPFSSASFYEMSKENEYLVHYRDIF